MLDYNEKIKTLLLTSVEEVRDGIDARWMIYKITQYCERWNENFDEIKSKILQDVQFARFFIKDPKRRNVYELFAIDYMVTELKKDVIKLSAAGSEARCLEEGQVVFGSSTSKTTKSIDFMEKRDGNIYYYTHKYIDADGGAQDNQFRDMVHFANEAKKYVEQHQDNVHFILLADGPYFERKDRKNKIYTGHRVTMMNINEL